MTLAETIACVTITYWFCRILLWGMEERERDCEKGETHVD